jgi:uncharacterized protein YbjT (DUF2867 family)
MTQVRSQSTGSSILVVGATGTLGSRLIRQLAAAGVKPRALVRTREKGDAIASLANPILGDLLLPESLMPAFRGVERVFVLGQPTPDMEALERNAIDAAVSAGAKRIVYMSNFTAKEGSELRPNHIHGVHERLVASLGVDCTVLGPTRYMTNVPFDWPSVLKDGLLLEAGGSGLMTCVDPDDVADVAVKALTEDGHEGQTYKLTSDDTFTAVDLARLLSKTMGREVRVFEGGVENAPMMAKYFAMVAEGLYKTTDTLGKILGRAPRSYADWLERNLPNILSRAA